MTEKVLDVPEHLAEIVWRYSTDGGAGSGKYRYSDLQEWEKRRFRLAARNVLDAAEDAE